MADPNTPGPETSEWTTAKWVMLVCAALAAGLSVVLASPAIDDPTVQAVLGGVVAVLTAVGGLTGNNYVSKRSALKIRKVQAERPLKIIGSNPPADPT